MKLATKTDVVSSAGCVRVELRIGNKVAVSVLSPKAARLMAQHLMTSADDAEVWSVDDGGVHTPRAAARVAQKPTRRTKRAADSSRDGEKP